MKIILAGNYKEYKRALIENGLTEREAIYGCSCEKMSGYEVDEVYEYGTFYKLKNHRKLRDFANSRIRLTN